MAKQGLSYLIGCLLILGCSQESSNADDLLIRVKNISAYDFENVFVDTNGGTRDYGQISSGESSEYVAFDSAYRYAFVELKIGIETFTLQPIDYVGETLLEPGKYTYAINASDEGDRFTRLTLELVED